MRKIFFIAGLMLTFFVENVQAQNSTDSIYVVKRFMGIQFIQDNYRLNFNQLPDIMRDNQAAYAKMRKAKSNNTVSAILSGVGGFLIGLNLGTALVGGDPNWSYSAVGGGLIIISIPISAKSYHLSQEAVNLYNADLQAATSRFRLYASYSANGLGIKMVF